MRYDSITPKTVSNFSQAMDLNSPDTNSTTASGFLAGGEQMGKRIRNFDWTKTSLGKPDTWPQALRTSISICLNSNFPIAVYWGKDLTLIYNDAWSPILGNKANWALGKPAREVWPDIWNDIEPQFKKAFSGQPGGSTDALLPMQRHGYIEECYFDFTFTPVYAESGNVEGVFNAVIETTYRMLNEGRSEFLNNLTLLLATSKSQEEVYKNLIHYFKNKNTAVSFGAVCSLQNENFTITHATHDPAIHFKLKKKLPFDSIGFNKFLFIPDIHEYFENPPKGHWPETPLEAVLIPVSDYTGKAIDYVFCGLNARRRFDEQYSLFFTSLADRIINISDTIRALEEERKRANALAEIDKAKTAFFSNISHEFRTPLTLLLGVVEQTLADPNTNPANHDRLLMMQRNAMRLLRLVNNLLDYSRIEAGRMAAQYKPTNIAKFTTDLAATFRSTIENAGLQFNVHCNEVHSPVYVDKNMWEKIVLNLLSNAFKYTLEGSISVSLTEENGSVHFSVKYTGIGIPDYAKPKLFERFYRVENTTARSYEGTGIGLSMINELVKLHGGEILVESEPGKGSVFTAVLPTGKKHLPADQVIESAQEYDEVFADFLVEDANALLGNNQTINQQDDASEKPIVLIVDDNSDIRNYLSDLLSAEYTVITAEHGEDALQQIKTSTPSLIISDVMMPVMDGLQLVNTLKANIDTQHIPVILLTARAGEESRIAGYETGADDYLVKPFAANELLSRVSAQIKLKQKRQDALKTLYNLFDEVSFGVIALKGDNLLIEYINKYNLDLWNADKKDVIGKPLFEARPEIQKFAEGIHQKVYETESRYEQRELAVPFYTNGNKTLRYFDVVIDPMRDDTGRIIGQLATSIDVTDKVLHRNSIAEKEVKYRALSLSLDEMVKLRTEQLHELNELLMHKNRELENTIQQLHQQQLKDIQKDNFIQMASHELKTPVTSITGYVQVLSKAYQQDETIPQAILKSAFGSIEKQLKRLTRLISELLDLSKIETGQLQFHHELFDLNVLIEEVIADIRHTGAKQTIILSQEGCYHVTGDRDRIGQVFINLLNNAIKFSAPESTIEITIAKHNGNFAAVSVKDQGIGIDKEEQDKIFERFYRVKSKETETYPGFGIGLFIARSILQKHNGNLFVESEKAKGAKFTFLLPIDHS